MCVYCGHREGEGCDPHFFLYAGEYHDAIKFGDERDTHVPDKSGERCPGCQAPKGSYHHAGCQYERCPVCGYYVDLARLKCWNCGSVVKFTKEEQHEML